MANRKNIKSNQLYHTALSTEKSGDIAGALKLYQKAVKTDPSNAMAWNRQMIIFRKNKSKEEEVKLIKEAIFEYQQFMAAQQEKWLQDNQEKADSSRELAKILGLLEPNGLPTKDDATIEKWETRLYLLEYRLKNARKKSTTTNKTGRKKPVIVQPKQKKSRAVKTKKTN